MSAWNPKANEIFLQAVDLHVDERSSYVEAACRDDAALRSEVNELLAVADEADSYLDAPLSVMGLYVDGIDAIAPVVLPGAQIGPYKLLEQIGEGGMGVVYMAQQTQPVKRNVALKIIKPGMDSKAVIARFEAEREALALMDHPNIARVLDAGTTSEIRGQASEVSSERAPTPDLRPLTTVSGHPYFVMELVRGIPITEYCEREQADTVRRLNLFIDVCRAVQHAHQKAVIHRDLKPSNVLVTLHDGEPVVKVIDFGVAKAVNHKLTEQSLFTHFSQMIGTPLYMSPEQTDIGGLDIDTRADVYSLGVLLYELLTGTTPFEKERLKRVGLDEMRRIIREEEPETISQRLASTRRIVPDHRRSTPGEQGGHRRPRFCFAPHSAMRKRRFQELDWIVGKALEKDRNRRYESASSLAADVQRYLVNEPITARPASLIYRFGKWLRRNPATASFAVVGALIAMAGLLGGWYHNHHLTSANLALDAANHHLHDANQKLGAALGDARRLEAEAVERERTLRLQSYVRDMQLAFGAWQFEQPQEAFRYLNRHQPVAGGLGGFEWYWMQSLFPAAKQTIAGHSAPLICADVSPDKRWIASGDKVGVIKVHALASGREIHTRQYADAEITSVSFAPDGHMLATAGVDRTIRLFRVGEWSEIGCLSGHDRTVTSIAWSPDSKRLVSGGRDHKVKIWDVEQLRESRTLPEFQDVVRYVAWSPTGQHVAAAVREDGIHLIDTLTWHSEVLLRQQDDWGLGAMALSFSPGGNLLASGGYSGRLFVHDVLTHRQLADVEAPSLIGSISFSPDERHLFAGLDKGQLLVCALHPHRHTIDRARLVHLGEGLLCAVRPSGRLLVTCDKQAAAIRTHFFSSWLADADRIHRFATVCLAISAAEDLACTLNSNGAPQLVTFSSGQTLGPLDGAPGGQIKGAWFFPNGQRLMVMDGAALRLYDAITRRHLGDLEPSADGLHSVTISPQGSYVAATVLCAGEWQLGIWNAHTFRRVGYLPAPLPEPSLCLAFSPDEQILAAASANPGQGKVVLWNLATGSIIDEIPETAIADLEFSPDGQWLALARGWEVLIWSTGERKMTTVLRGHSSPISDLALSPAGRTLASVDNEGIIRLWHMPTQREIGILRRQALRAGNLLFRSPYQLVNFADPQPTKPSAPCDVIVFDTSDAANASQSGNHDTNNDG